ncbi:MAG: hypothetical protein FVQ79_05640 [Planctomycetes bacterium]|nr:hypothetical protein [Planctomycetota bacterium]
MIAFFYAMLYAGLRVILKNFPWNTSFWKSAPIKELRKKAVQNRVIGYPYRILNAKDFLPSLSLLEVIICSLMITWWLHVIRWVIDEPYEIAVLIMAAIFISLFRLLTYVTPCYFSPISIWGRIRTFRFIIPGYDKIFLAPMCILFASVAVPLACLRMGMDKTWSVEITIFIILLLAFSFPPSLKKWRLTGKYRMIFSRQFKQQVQRSQPQLQKSLKTIISNR